jgi:glyoxylase-like metal-dependent hydrolase (beta-lactamase superfamily II)
VTKEDEIGMQLRAMGIPPQDVRWVVQTHLHSDHADGMGDFPKAEFLIGAADYPRSQGTLPCHNPEWLKPTLVDFRDGPIQTFERSYTLTKDEVIAIVPTPGHSVAHQSVVLRDSDAVYFFAGDVSFDIPQIHNGVIAGICADRRAARATAARVRAFFQRQPTIYLPSHDPDSGRRLVAREIVGEQVQ